MKTAMLPTALLAALVSTALAAESGWVKRGPDGKLVYKTTAAGDRIMDFSHAGYMGGGVGFPDAAVKRTKAPSGGEDDTKIIHFPVQRAVQPDREEQSIVIVSVNRSARAIRVRNARLEDRLHRRGTGHPFRASLRRLQHDEQ